MLRVAKVNSNLYPTPRPLAVVALPILQSALAAHASRSKWRFRPPKSLSDYQLFRFSTGGEKGWFFFADISLFVILSRSWHPITGHPVYSTDVTRRYPAEAGRNRVENRVPLGSERGNGRYEQARNDGQEERGWKLWCPQKAWQTAPIVFARRQPRSYRRVVVLGGGTSFYPLSPAITFPILPSVLFVRSLA